MPELPEVETIRQGLKNSILDKVITKITILKSRLVRNSDRYFVNTLKQQSIKDINRIGKLLIFELSDGQNWLLVHLKMTGQLIYQNDQKTIVGGHNLPLVDSLPGKYSYIIFDFIDGSSLFFNDMRQFGYLHIVDKVGRQKIEERFGIEPGQPTFTWQSFKQLFVGRKTALKSLLLNQQIIAGIGNIYADEICFRAKVLPDRRINTLADKEIKSLYSACRYIMKKAIEHRGTTFSDYRDASNNKGNFVKFLKVYGRAGQKCLRCGQSDIKKIKLGGRGTHYCPVCQK